MRRCSDTAGAYGDTLDMKTKGKRTASTTLPGGTLKLADDLILTRVGYGAMQLAVRMYSARQQTTTVQSLSCARLLSSGSPTLTPATSTAHTSPISLSKRRCIHIRSSCGS